MRAVQEAAGASLFLERGGEWWLVRSSGPPVGGQGLTQALRASLRASGPHSGPQDLTQALRVPIREVTSYCMIDTGGDGGGWCNPL